MSESAEVTRARQYFQQGVQFAARGAWAEALDALTRAVRSAPDHVEARLRLGEVYLLRGRAEDGLRVLDQGLARGGIDDEQRVLMLGQAASCAAAMNRYDAARSYLERALEIEPKNRSLLDRVAAVCCKGGEFSTGFDYFLEASQTTPS